MTFKLADAATCQHHDVLLVRQGDFTSVVPLEKIVPRPREQRLFRELQTCKACLSRRWVSILNGELIEGFWLEMTPDERKAFEQARAEAEAAERARGAP